MPKALAKAHTANTSESDDIEWRTAARARDGGRHHAVPRAPSGAHGHRDDRCAIDQGQRVRPELSHGRRAPYASVSVATKAARSLACAAVSRCACCTASIRRSVWPSWKYGAVTAALRSDG